MNGMLVDGKKIAAEIEARLAREIRRLKRTAALRPSFFWRKRTLTLLASFCRRKNKPHLAVVLVGEDPASRVYVKKKEEAAERVGIGFSLHTLPSSVPQERVLDLIRRLNKDRSVNGIIVQLPLPEGLDEELIISHISLDKDVDGLNPRSSFIPATAVAVLEVLKRQKVRVAGSRAVVVGRGKVAGLPIAMALLANDATVTIAHSKTVDLGGLTRQADILVSAVGRSRFIKPAFVKRNAAVIDVGISRIDGKLLGDVDPAVEKKVRFLTPVPGGIGPITVAKLLENTVRAFQFQDIR